MRQAARVLLLIYVFTIPWEYSLDLGAPFGNIARIVGLLLLTVTVYVVLLAGKIHTPDPLQWLVLAMYLWLTCTYFWTIEPIVAAACRFFACGTYSLGFDPMSLSSAHRKQGSLECWLPCFPGFVTGFTSCAD